MDVLGLILFHELLMPSETIPEALSCDLAGFWSRRIDDVNRIVYRIQDGKIEIAQCKGHYNDK